MHACITLDCRPVSALINSSISNSSLRTFIHYFSSEQALIILTFEFILNEAISTLCKLRVYFNNKF